MTMQQWQEVDQACKLLSLLGDNGCIVFPEGLCARMTAEQLQKLSNKMLDAVQKSGAELRKKLPKQKGKLDLMLDEIMLDGKKSVKDFEKQLDAKEKVKLCNKVWNWWMERKKECSPEELENGLAKTLGKWKRATEHRLLGDSFAGKDIELDGIVFTAHAIERAKQRISGLSKCKSMDIASRLLNELRSSREAECKLKWKALQLLNHKLEKTKYMLSKRNVLHVMVGNVVKTVHLNESKRFEVCR